MLLQVVGILHGCIIYTPADRVSSVATKRVRFAFLRGSFTEPPLFLLPVVFALDFVDFVLFVVEFFILAPPDNSIANLVANIYKKICLDQNTIVAENNFSSM